MQPPIIKDNIKIITIKTPSSTPGPDSEVNSESISADVRAIKMIPIITQLLDVVCRTTGMGFAAISRMTEDKYIACSTQDNIDFGLKPGDELKLETTLCNEVRLHNNPLFIENVDEDETFRDHAVPKTYKFKSYISVPIHRKDGSFFGTLCALDMSPSKIKTKEIEGMFALFSDLISFHLDAVQELDTVNLNLEEERKTSELREQFIAILGHDLKNPIATTRMCSDILLKFSKEELVKKQAGLIKSTSFRMEALIDNILDFARGRLGEGITLKTTKDPQTLESAIKQVISELKAISPQRRIKATFDLAKPVNLDVNRISQLLANLLNNADTHGDQNHPIEINVISNNGEFKLSVKNRGNKIPEESLSQIFEPFVKDEDATGKQGLGLGLFIASEIAKAHNGEIKVKSTEEETTFEFVFSNKN